MVETQIPAPTLLAVDLGLRSGLAHFAADGRLLMYRSTHFGSVKSLKKGVPGIFKSLGHVEHVVVEGDRNLGEVWKKWAHYRALNWNISSASTRPMNDLTRSLSVAA